MFTWYEKDIQINGQPEGLIISIRGEFHEERVSISIDVEHISKPGLFKIPLYDKAGEGGRHTQDFLQSRHLLRLQKLLDKAPKTWDLFRPWAAHLNPSLETFLSSIP